MIEIVQLLKELGSASVDLLWLPVLVWTGLALIAAIVLRYYTSLSSIYQYHFRAAVLAALPAGILTAPLIHALLKSGESTASSALFIIQNPIPITVTPAAQAGFDWSDPAFWIGAATVLAATIALTVLVKLLVDYLHLRKFTKRLKSEVGPNPKKYDGVDVLISDEVETPCTFGWFEKRIVMPRSLKGHPEKYNMALRHELAHIRNRDYLINNFIQSVKALFYFHPLVHYFAKQVTDYREIYCDLNVLTNAHISQKNYAKLLYELAPKPLFKNTAAVNMAVNPSTLKKRIQIMKTQRNLTPSLKRSVILTLFLGLSLTGFMACSDITNDGLTTAEVQEFQQNAENTIQLDIEESPMWVINGEIVEAGEKEKISRIKPKYIKSIDVLKGEAATAAYGEDGKNGVIKIQLYNEEKALSDLKDEKINLDVDANFDTVYMAVEDMPELVNQTAFYKGFEYPVSCKEAGIEGTVYIQFVVTKTGDLSNFEVIQGVGGETGGHCDEAALRYVKSNAEFSPGTHRGKPVNVRFTLPVQFNLN